MLTILLIVVILLLVVLLALVAYVLFKPQSSSLNDAALGLIKQDLMGMTDTMTKNQQRVDDLVGKSQEQMRDSIMKQFSESSKLITDVTDRLRKLDETNKRVVDVADELKTLQNVLQNPKQRGVLGEYYLQSVLENVMPPDRFELQYKFADGDIVDAVIKLDRGQILPIDSKFSLENYNRLVEETNKDRRDALIKLFKQDLKNRIDETAKYIRPSEGTMDFAFMFIPSEAIYYDLLINKVGTVQTSARDLIEYAFRDKKVIIVSPTSFMAYLQTVMQGLRSLQIEGQAKEIQVRVGQLGQHLVAYEVFMQKLGNSLGTTVNHYNAAHKELKKVDKDIVKIANTSPAIEPLLVDKPNFDE
jgi:DNA recombination protein RmuC